MKKRVKARTLEEIEAAFLCIDCGVDTGLIDEYYMVHHYLWRLVVPEVEGMLCIGCLEGRVGRRLRSGDFTHCPLNADSEDYPKSARLQDRLDTP